jgi:CRISPR-associated protein Cmr4
MNPELGSPYWLHALTPLRIGGDPGLGAINLPTMREQHTGHPVVPGSVIKGVLRAAMADPVGVLVRELFGPEREDASDHSGALTFSDARLVALPVRSLWGTFAWCTSRLCLRRLERDRRDLGVDEAPVALPDTDDVLVTPGSAMLSKGQLFIEEQAVPAKEEPALAPLAARLAKEIWPEDKAARDLFAARLVVLPDDALNALALISLEVRARVSLDPLTGTAAKSGPWLEESMPAETLLAGFTTGRDTWVFAKGAKPAEGETLTGRDALTLIRQADALKGVLSFGGHTSVGYGRASFRLVPPPTPKEG